MSDGMWADLLRLQRRKLGDGSDHRTLDKRVDAETRKWLAANVEEDRSLWRFVDPMAE